MPQIGSHTVLSLKPSVSQGWGDCRRVRGYLSAQDGGFMVLHLFWAIFIVPETKGKSLEEIKL